MALIEAKPNTLEQTGRARTISLKNVLYATDFSETSEAALPYAGAICRRFGSTLHVVHVISDASLLLMTGGVDYVSMGTIYEDAHTEAQEKLQQIANRLDGIPLRSYVQHGQVWKNLDSIIAEIGVDLLVVGTHGRTGLGKLLLGSVAEDILRHAGCPVLTVGPEVAGHARLPVYHGKSRDLAPVDLDLERIVYATDFAPASVIVAPVAVKLAEEFESQLTLLHVFEGYENLGERPGPIEEGIRRLQELVPRNARLAYAPETVMQFGTAADVIVKVAGEREADLIVLGAHPTVGTTHLPWTTVHQVVAHASCPVLTVRE